MTKFAIRRILDFLTRNAQMFSVVSGTVDLPPSPTEPGNFALKSYSPYLKTCEVDSPDNVQFVLPGHLLLELGLCFLEWGDYEMKVLIARRGN